MMRYDPLQPLIGVHIPKCAGTSMQLVLRLWFGRQLHLSYFDEYRNRMPPRFKNTLLQRVLARRSGHGPCIYGHFNRERGLGIEDYYPAARQFFTILRDPLGAVCSRYFFLKQLGVKRMWSGRSSPISADFASLDDYVAYHLHRPFFANHLPARMNLDNYAETFESQFVYVGVAEDLESSVSRLAARLGFVSTAVPHARVSEHDEQLDRGLGEEYLRSRPFECAIYKYAKEHYREP